MVSTTEVRTQRSRKSKKVSRTFQVQPTSHLDPFDPEAIILVGTESAYLDVLHQLEALSKGVRRLRAQPRLDKSLSPIALEALPAMTWTLGNLASILESEAPVSVARVRMVEQGITPEALGYVRVEEPAA